MNIPSCGEVSGQGKGPVRAWRISAGQMEQTISQASVERPTHAKPLTRSTAWGLGKDTKGKFAGNVLLGQTGIGTV